MTKKEKIELLLNDKVSFYPPKQIIEFVIDDKFETTGSIEECDNPKGFALYIDGDEYGFFDTIDEAKTEIADYVKHHVV